MGGADAALIKVGNLVLKADGGFVPNTLPRDSFEPIDFHGHANLINTDGGPPDGLEEMQLEFDRDGMLETVGCRSARSAGSPTPRRRGTRKCAGAIIGTGHVGAIFELSGGPVEAGQGDPLQWPAQGRQPDSHRPHLHDHPDPRTYTAVIPIKRLKHGPYSYRATFDVPKLAADGVLTHIDGRIGRRYDFRGSERSYVNARCTTGVIRTHGHFLFADGTIMDGTLEKPCTPRPPGAGALATFLYLPTPGR